jgi:hypothetical protein
VADERAVETGRHRLGEKPSVLAYDPSEPRTGVIIGQKAVGHLNTVGTKGKLSCIPRPEHGSGKNRHLNRDLERLQDLADATRLLPAFRREISLSFSVSDPVCAVTRHACGVRMAKKQDEASTAKPLDERCPLGPLGCDG